MYKKLLITILIIFSLAISVNAQDVGDPCINDDDCTSDICQGGECRAGDILDLITYEPPEEEAEEDDDDDDDTPGYDASSSQYQGDGFCLSDWDCTEWTACITGKQTRTCTDLNQCQAEEPIYGKPSEEMLCTVGEAPTCFDGILNQNEAGVDCGGPCAKICATCYDQEENCHGGLCEEGVDCGGPCMPCTLEKASRSVSFWIIFITAILVLLVLVLGFWYWKLKGSAEDVGEQVTTFTKKPPTQPSSMLRI